MAYTLPNAEEASRRYGQVFLTLTRRSVDTKAFRSLSRIGLPQAGAHLLRQFSGFVGNLVASHEFDQYFTDREAALAYFGGAEGLAVTMASNQLAAYQRSIDAASVVFAHSALDAAASELCWITAFSSLDDWHPFVSARKVSLLEVSERDFDTLLSEKVAAHLKALERKSLLERVDRLFALCQPGEHYEGIRGFRFDRERLERLDGLRHEIVHQDVDVSAFATVDADLEFLFQSGLHLWGMVHFKYGVQVDVRTLFGLEGRGLETD